MNLWRIDHPLYQTDRSRRSNNGTLKFPFSLPGVECCTTWAGISFLALECPKELRNLRTVKHGWPVGPDELEGLRSKLRKFPGFEQLSMKDLKPGTSLLPLRFSPPKVDQNDFLWPALGVMVVSLRIAAILKQHCPDDFVGIPIPDHSNWVLVDIRNRTLPPIERRSDFICPKCGRANKVSESFEFSISEDMLPEGDLFTLDTTLYVLITDELKQQLEKAGARNIAYERVTVEPKQSCL